MKHVFIALSTAVAGTPAGVDCVRNPPVWMKANDTIEIEIEIEGIGVLANPVVGA